MIVIAHALRALPSGSERCRLTAAGRMEATDGPVLVLAGAGAGWGPGAGAGPGAGPGAGAGQLAVRTADESVIGGNVRMG